MTLPGINNGSRRLSQPFAQSAQANDVALKLRASPQSAAEALTFRLPPQHHKSISSMYSIYQLQAANWQYPPSGRRP